VDLRVWVGYETTITAPVPRPTEIKYDRLRMGQVKRDTVIEMLKVDRKNLGRIVE